MANAHFWQLELARLEFKLYGGSVQLTLDVDKATHVIVSSETRFEFYSLIKIPTGLRYFCFLQQRKAAAL